MCQGFSIPFRRGPCSHRIRPRPQRSLLRSSTLGPPCAEVRNECVPQSTRTWHSRGGALNLTVLVYTLTVYCCTEVGITTFCLMLLYVLALRISAPELVTHARLLYLTPHAICNRKVRSALREGGQVARKPCTCRGKLMAWTWFGKCST